MSQKQAVLSKFQSFLPKLSEREQASLESLPAEFRLNVPYFIQEEVHWSGAAVVQMLRKFHEGIEVSQSLIAHEAGWNDWRTFTHETFKEDLLRYLAKRNYVPGCYYPGRYVLPNFDDGIQGADFIAQNYELVNQYGFEYFKALLVTMKAPVYVRLHFHTGWYPMSEAQARKIDSCGHAVLIVGYDEEGFIVHDPWDREKWGGTRGGEYRHIDYETMTDSPSVNCCLGLVATVRRLDARFEYPRFALCQNRDFELVLNVSLPGIDGIFSDIYPVTNVRANLLLEGGIESRDQLVQAASTGILSGGASSLSWGLTCGSQPGSYPVKAIVRATVKVPAFGWETNTADEFVTVETFAERRIDIKNVEWLNRYGRS